MNAQNRSGWSLQGRLRGGHQSGAYRLVDATGRRAVLKWSTAPAWAPVIVAAAPVIAAARSRGWPTPAWLAVGKTSAGLGYQVQEYVEGRTGERVTREWLDLVLPVLASQAGLGTAEMRDWSRYDRDVVFTDRDSYAGLVAESGPAGAHLIRVIATFTSAHAAAVVSSNDLVHGDVHPDNVLITPGRGVVLVDAEAVGRGSRLHDLSSVVLYAALWGDSSVIDQLAGECRSVAGPGEFEVVLSAVALGLLAFGVRNWPADDLAVACHTVADLLVRLFAGEPERALTT